MEKLIEYYNELTNNDFNEEELRVELDSLNALKKICKWLVDNDKIDLLRLDNRIALSEFNKVERVLMALAISDTPIDDLISYLR